MTRDDYVTIATSHAPSVQSEFGLQLSFLASGLAVLLYFGSFVKLYSCSIVGKCGFSRLYHQIYTRPDGGELPLGDQITPQSAPNLRHKLYKPDSVRPDLSDHPAPAATTLIYKLLYQLLSLLSHSIMADVAPPTGNTTVEINDAIFCEHFKEVVSTSTSCDKWVTDCPISCIVHRV